MYKYVITFEGLKTNVRAIYPNSKLSILLRSLTKWT